MSEMIPGRSGSFFYFLNDMRDERFSKSLVSSDVYVRYILSVTVFHDGRALAFESPRAAVRTLFQFEK